MGSSTKRYARTEPAASGTVKQYSEMPIGTNFSMRFAALYYEREHVANIVRVNCDSLEIFGIPFPAMPSPSSSSSPPPSSSSRSVSCSFSSLVSVRSGRTLAVISFLCVCLEVEVLDPTPHNLGLQPTATLQCPDSWNRNVQTSNPLSFFRRTSLTNEGSADIRQLNRLRGGHTRSESPHRPGGAVLGEPHESGLSQAVLADIARRAGRSEVQFHTFVTWIPIFAPEASSQRRALTETTTRAFAPHSPQS
eukprot:3277178-Rhodomonas_salina.1